MENNWFEKNGFDPKTRETYVVIGENTYAIKDELKAQGYKYNKLLGWHGPTLVELPKEYHCCKVEFNDVAAEITLDELRAACGGTIPKNYQQIRYGFKAGCIDFMKELKSKYIKTYTQFYDCECGDRIEIKCKLEKSNSFNGRYGISYVYSFVADDKYLFTWFTSKKLDIKNDYVTLIGTVKEHNEYNGNCQVLLTRCIVKEA